MPDKEATPQTKPAEMSFSDWKKMKNALNTSENTAPPKDPPRSRKPTTTTNARPNNNNLANNYNEYRNPQSLHYFECLKRNNQRILNGNMGFNNDLCGPPQIPAFPFNNQLKPNPMMNCFNQSYNARSNFSNFGTTTNNFMPNNNNNFMMPRGGIPQQPFPVNNYQNAYRTHNPFRPISQTTSNSRPQRKLANSSNNKATNKETTKTDIAKDDNAMPSTSSKPADPLKTTSVTSKDVPKTKVKKQKRWNAKPPKPPSMIATTAEDKEAKQRMWREYRQKMKPFRNRDFYNAKRVIQRLGKKNAEELDEKEKERLTRAKETVEAHKAMLSERARRWTLANEAAGKTFGISAVEKPTSSVYVGTSAVQSPMNTTVPSSSTPAAENGAMNGTAIPAKTNANQWGLWNNFIPGGIIFNSTE